MVDSPDPKVLFVRFEFVSDVDVGANKFIIYVEYSYVTFDVILGGRSKCK